MGEKRGRGKLLCVCVYVFRKGKLQIKKKNEQHGWNRVGTFSVVTCQTLLRIFAKSLEMKCSNKIHNNNGFNTHIHENSIDRLHNECVNEKDATCRKINLVVKIFSCRSLESCQKNFIEFHDKNLSPTLPYTTLKIIHFRPLPPPENSLPAPVVNAAILQRMTFKHIQLI